MTLEGQVLGDYRVLHELGRGGMGIVYLAEQVSLGRKVALKVLPRASAVSQEILSRFRREAEAASRLDHPSICAVFGTGIHDGIPWISMRHVEGQALSRFIQERRRKTGEAPLESVSSSETFRFEFGASQVSTRTSPGDPAADPVPDAGAPPEAAEPTSTTREEIRWAVSFIERTARALQFAHEARVIHRDIKPGNIMVTPEGNPVILDFGLARQIEGAQGAHLTQSGDLMGTPHYMSPEQISGHGLVDVRTDVYSLGITLFELLCGQRPFDAPNRERLYRAILHEDPAPVSSRNPSVERDLELVVATALERDLNRRYQSAQALADDLKAVLEHEPIAARSLGPVHRMRKWARRNPAVAVTLAAAAALIIFGIFDFQRIKAARARAQSEKEAADDANAKLKMELSRTRTLRLAAEAQALSATEPALALHLALEAAAIECRPQVDRALREALAATPEERLFPAPSLEALVDDSDDVPVRVAPGPGAARPALPRLRSAGSGLPPGPRAGARFRLRASDRLRDQYPPSGDVHFGAGLVITLADDAGGVPVVWELGTGRMVSVLAGHTDRVSTARFSPDGRRAVTAGEDGTIRVFDVATGEQAGAPYRIPANALGIRPKIESAWFERDGELVLAVADGSVVLVWEPGKPRPDGNFDRYRVQDGPPLAAQHPSLPIVASVATDRVFAWTFGREGTGATHVELDDPESDVAVRAIAWSPTGLRIAAADLSGRITIWSVPPPPWKAQFLTDRFRLKAAATAAAHDSEVRCLAFSGDGRFLASGGGDHLVKVWDLGDPRAAEVQIRPALPPVAHGGPVMDLAWSPDGASLATASTDRCARVLDARRGTTELELRGHMDWVVRVIWSPDGSHLLTFTTDGVARLFPAAGTGADRALPPCAHEPASVEWSGDGQAVMAVERDGLSRLVPVDRPNEQRTFAPGGRRRMSAARFLPEGRGFAGLLHGPDWLMAGGIGAAKEQWSLRDPGPVAGGTSPPRDRAGLVFSGDGRHALAVSPAGVPVLVEVATGHTVPCAPLAGRHHALAAHPARGEFLVWPSGKAPVLLAPSDPPAWRALPEVPGTPRAAAFDDEGRRLLLLDAAGRAEVVSGLGPDATPTPASLGEQAAMPAFISGAAGIVIAPRDGPVQVVPDPGAPPSVTLPLAGSLVLRMLTAPRGQVILLTPGEVLVFDLERRDWRGVHRIGAASLADWDLSADGRRLVMAFADGALRVLHLDPESVARSRTVREPTAQERERLEMGTPDERRACHQREAEWLRDVEIRALEQRARNERSVKAALAWIRRILDAGDPLRERFPDALAFAESTVRTTRNRNADALHVLALAQEANGRTKEAAASVRDALALVKNGDPERETLARLLRSLEATDP